MLQCVKPLQNYRTTYLQREGDFFKCNTNKKYGNIDMEYSKNCKTL